MTDLEKLNAAIWQKVDPKAYDKVFVDAAEAGPKGQGVEAHIALGEAAVEKAAPDFVGAIAALGMVVVPVEPTEAMLDRARDWSMAKYSRGIGNDAAAGCWKAMIGEPSQ